MAETNIGQLGEADQRIEFGNSILTSKKLCGFRHIDSASLKLLTCLQKVFQLVADLANQMELSRICC